MFIKIVTNLITKYHRQIAKIISLSKNFHNIVNSEQIVQAPDQNNHIPTENNDNPISMDNISMDNISLMPYYTVFVTSMAAGKLAYKILTRKGVSIALLRRFMNIKIAAIIKDLKK